MKHAAHRVDVQSASGTYPVLVGEGILDALPAWLGEFAPAHRYAIISDSRVASLHGSRVLERLLSANLRADLLSFSEGEASKSREMWGRLTDSLLNESYGRDSVVIALGGGVTGDLAGFVAATYMRGLPLVQIPTSLLAMVDSSVGGKTGVDTPAGKNLVGAFHPPRLVVADVTTLRTLPGAHLRAGLAEAVKHGAIADASYLDFILNSADALLGGEEQPLIRLVQRSVEIKASVVSDDEREGGRRRILNFGHTIGHALETLSGYTLLHGEAVAVGMVIEARIGERLGITRPHTTRRLASVLRALGLPTTTSDHCPAEELLKHMRLDKKTRGGEVEFALLEDIGTPITGVRADEQVILEEVTASAGPNA